jgi:putative PIN family toxin of toxin-antitoxin system
LIATESKIKVVIDTNVFISALLFGGNALEIIRLFLKGDIEVYLSPFIIEEVTRILREKFLWEEAKIEKILELIRSKTKEVYPQVKVSIIKSKDEDNRILECALESKVDYLISGDKRHILPLKEFKGIRIVSVSEFLDKYQGTAP